MGISDINGGAALSQAQLAPELKLLDAGCGKPGSRESRVTSVIITRYCVL